MGCSGVQVSGAFIHLYDVRRSSTFYNCVLVHDPRRFILDEVEHIFHERGLPFSVKIPSLRSFADLGKALRVKGYSLLPPWTLMRHVRALGDRNPEVEVEIVTPHQLNKWIAASNMSDLPESSQVARRKMLTKASQTAKVQFILARFKKKSAGVGVLFMDRHEASIHLMSTLPEFRRKRVATTIVLHALTCRRRDIDLTWLRTRKGAIGERVYSQLGFSSVTDILSYTTTPDLEDGISNGKLLT
jgi:hypothetical protein